MQIACGDAGALVTNGRGGGVLQERNSCGGKICDRSEVRSASDGREAQSTTESQTPPPPFPSIFGPHHLIVALNE
jgi:hypothetical protein